MLEAKTTRTVPQPVPARALLLQRKIAASSAKASSAAVAPPLVHEVLQSPGQPLDSATRAFMEPRFGHDFSGVRVHTDAKAAQSARAVNAHAYTVGSHVAFAGGQYAPTSPAGKQLLAHELSHVVQQSGASVSTISSSSPLQIAPPNHPLEAEAHRDAKQTASGGSARLSSHAAAISTPRLHRYETGEHASFGETKDILVEMLSKRNRPYTVAKGDTPASIAAQFGISEAILVYANINLYKPLPAPKGQKPVTGFAVGQVISIPPVLNAAHQQALASKEMTFQSGGVDLSYGQGITMGDLFEDADQMAKNPDQLKTLKPLIDKEKGGGNVTNEQWNNATGGRYLDLASKNDTHFAPSNPTLVAPSGTSPANHKAAWEKFHKMALEASKAGNLNRALALNSFGDHFLTDAFAAGHLINKADVAVQFQNNLPLTKGSPNKAGEAFFDAVANEAFVGDVKKAFSGYETVEWKGYIFRPDIDRVSRFSALLQGIYAKEPGLVSNVAAKAAHDTLNEKPGGLSVEDAHGEKWQLTGDGTLNADNRKRIRAAVAQSQMNVLDSYQTTATLDFPALFKLVWDFTPHPTAAGTKDVQAAVTSGTSISSPYLISKFAAMIKDSYPSLLNELVRRKILKKT